MSSVFTVIILLGWILSSCLLSTYANTAFLNEFNDASGLTFFRFCGSALFGFFANIIFGSLSIIQTIHNIPTLLLPSLFLLSANFFNSVSLNLTGISVTYITKSTIPVWTALITVLYFKQKTKSNTIYLTLLPTVIGVAMSSLSDIDFNLNGFIAAVSSTLSQTMLNIICRNTINKSDLNGSQFQFIMASINTFILLPVYIFTSNENSAIYKISWSWPWSFGLVVFVITPLAYHIEYVLNCLLVGRLSSLTFSMTDITRRLLIIICGVIMFNKTLNFINKCGIVLALGGVASYSYLSNRTNETKTK